MAPRINLLNRRFYRLRVVRFQRQTSQHRSGWRCLCDCGNHINHARTSDLLRGRIRSCGCLHAENNRRRRLSHGMAYSPESRAYKNAKGRCTNPKNQDYPSYGGRGIEFRFGSFNEFYTELGRRPEGMSLDRINNDGHYEVGNVRWATDQQQRINKRKGLKRVRRKQLFTR